jgi:hypothetical protein
LPAVLMTGCSWIFQPHLPSDYNRHDAPDCSSSGGYAVFDFIDVALDAVLIMVANQQGTLSGGQFALNVADAVVFGASAITGLSWAHECSDAKARWAAEEDETGPRQNREVVVPTPRIALPQSRGFFCASSAAAVDGFCTKTRDACAEARDIAVTVAPDLSACTPTEAAWCYGDRCSPTDAGCAARRQRAMGTDGVAPECEETR